MALSLAVDGLRRHSNNSGGRNSVTINKNNNTCTTGNQKTTTTCVLSPSISYFIIVIVFLCFAGWLLIKFIITPPVGCREDNEGSWAIGVFFGDSPFSLKPIEDMNLWKDDAASWPVANPLITCASVSHAGVPSNFVADPFLYVQGATIYMFYETKNSITMQGDIGVAKSMDKGVTWVPLGIALDEEWHLSYPYVFEYNENIYMMPEGSRKGDLRLYRAIDFPLKWKLEKIVMRRPMVDSVVIPHNGKFWLFGSDHSRVGSRKNGELEIWHSSSPLGPWRPHKKNPVHNMDESMGARNGGRPFVYNGTLYRIGQDCGETYGKRIRIFKVEVLTTKEFKEVEVPSGIKAAKSIKGRNAWNGVRNHHLDVQQVSYGKWIAVVDGDRVPSGDTTRRFVIGFLSVIALAILFGMVLGVPDSLVKRRDTFLARAFCSRMSLATMNLHARIIRPNNCIRVTLLLFAFFLAVALTSAGVWYLYGGNGAQEAYPLNGHYSQFTLLALSYDARLWNLKMYVQHYSRCSSVREIVVVWNKGVPPHPDDFDSAVPVRIRVEKHNSLNNRFKVDHLIKTRAVLELDDDIIMSCNDIERAFLVWRQNPNKIVGFHPRLVTRRNIKYRDEHYARSHGGYNMILTGAAFLDTRFAFERYWSHAADQGRVWVDKNFNCEDLLMNFLYANATGSSSVVEYVKPAWLLETSILSRVAISEHTQAHFQVRTNCLAKFSEIYGHLAHRKLEFGRRKDGWDV